MNVQTAGSGHDAVIVGAGPNGLVAANHLVDRGWSVVVLEAEQSPGGAVRSDRSVQPEFVHDTFSSFYPLWAASRAVRGFDLERHGLRWCHAPAVLGHPLPDGRWALLHRDREVSAALFDDQHSGDGQAWLDLCDSWDRFGPALTDGLTSRFPPLRAAARLLPAIATSGGLELVRRLLTPAATLGAELFGGDGPGLLLAGNAGHADMPLDSPGSGVFALLMTMLGQTVGFPVPEGGAQQLTSALVARLQDRGGVLVTGARAARVLVQSGRACAVVTEDGDQYPARRAVIADVAVARLFGGLVADQDVPSAVRRQLRNHQLDPATIKVDWALSGPIPWASRPSHQPGTVHFADDLTQMSEATSQVAAGIVPAKPFMLAGQMTTTDPSRSPMGTESFWAYTHVPQPDAMRGDALDKVSGRWDHSDLERFADRMQQHVEQHAPGFGSRVITRRILGPHEFEERDANLVGGAINGGTAQLQQELVFRPVPAMWGRPETGIAGLYLGSSSAHPGGGVHGAPGANAAAAALLHDRLGRLPGLRRSVARGVARG